jgi:hypothetical protein
MTQMAPIPGAPLAATSTWDVCDQCQAPLEPRQRYCVVCGSRRLHGDDPAARYLSEATRRSRVSAAPVAVAPAPRRSGLGTIALALIPLAAALGVLAGRSQTPTDERIVEALKAQQAPVVNVTGVGAATGATADGAGERETTASAKTPKKAKGSSGSVKRTSDGSEVLATGPAGDARKLEGSKVTSKQLDESKDAVKRINESKGEEYVDSQRNLPDQIVIP